MIRGTLIRKSGTGAVDYTLAFPQEIFLVWSLRGRHELWTQTDSSGEKGQFFGKPLHLNRDTTVARNYWGVGSVYMSVITGATLLCSEYHCAFHTSNFYPYHDAFFIYWGIFHSYLLLFLLWTSTQRLMLTIFGICTQARDYGTGCVQLCYVRF